MPNPPIPLDPQPIERARLWQPNGVLQSSDTHFLGLDGKLHPRMEPDDLGVFATDHEEECTMNFWAGFAVGVITALACCVGFLAFKVCPW